MGVDTFAYSVSATSGPARTTPATVVINVVQVNDAPVVAAPAELFFTEDHTPVQIDGWQLSDIDSAVFNITITAESGMVRFDEDEEFAVSATKVGVAAADANAAVNPVFFNTDDNTDLLENVTIGVSVLVSDGLVVTEGISFVNVSFVAREEGLERRVVVAMAVAAGLALVCGAGIAICCAIYVRDDKAPKMPPPPKFEDLVFAGMVPPPERELAPRRAGPSLWLGVNLCGGVGGLLFALFEERIVVFSNFFFLLILLLLLSHFCVHPPHPSFSPPALSRHGDAGGAAAGGRPGSGLCAV